MWKVEIEEKIDFIGTCEKYKKEKIKNEKMVLLDKCVTFISEVELFTPSYQF